MQATRKQGAGYFYYERAIPLENEITECQAVSCQYSTRHVCHCHLSANSLAVSACPQRTLSGCVSVHNLSTFGSDMHSVQCGYRIWATLPNHSRSFASASQILNSCAVCKWCSVYFLIIAIVWSNGARRHCVRGYCMPCHGATPLLRVEGLRCSHWQTFSGTMGSFEMMTCNSHVII